MLRWLLGLLAPEQYLDARQGLTHRQAHPVQVRLDGVLGFAQRLGDRPNRLSPEVLEVKNSALGIGQILPNDLLIEIVPLPVLLQLRVG